MVARIACDVCGSEIGPGQRTLLHTITGELRLTHPAVDLCPACVEKLRGWIDGIADLDARPLEKAAARA